MGPGEGGQDDGINRDRLLEEVRTAQIPGGGAGGERGGAGQEVPELPAGERAREAAGKGVQAVLITKASLVVHGGALRLVLRAALVQLRVLQLDVLVERTF